MRNFIATLFLFLLSLFSASSFATTYYLSSSSGNDNNSGTDPSSAWQSLNKLNSSGLQPGDNVLFKRGDTFYGTIVASNASRYGAYGSGEKPVITGFTTVTSWTNKGGNIWESTDPVSNLSTLQMVVVNGVNTPMGRYPNASSTYPFLPNFINFESHSGSGSGNTSITSSSLSGSNWTGADVVVRVNSWTYDKETITSQSGGSINYSGQASGLADGWGFFIQNSIKTLDVQNEWFYDASTKKISIYSIGTPENVQIATRENLLTGNSYTSNPVTIDNLSFRGANTNAIYVNGNFSITNCDISYSGFEGLALDGGNMQGGTISNNTFSNCGSSSILTTGSMYGLQIKGNSIVGSGIISVYKQNDYASSGMIISTQGTIVQYNSVDSSAYCGIQFSGNNIEIRNNLVNHSNMIRDDAGGIYTGYKNQTGKIIDGNIVLNSVGNTRGGPSDKEAAAYGIFIDDFGSNVTITNNTVANCTSAGINLHDTKNVTVTGNTVYNNNGLPGSGWSNGQLFVQADAGEFTSYVRDNTVTNNIFFAGTANQYSLKYYADPNADNNVTSFGTIDYNYYAKPLSVSTAIASSQNIGKGEFSLVNWQSISGRDANSKGSPKSITEVKDIRFEYNVSTQSKTVSLGANYIDVKGNRYNGSITLPPYASAVLIRDGSYQNQQPVANAGDDQTITLPSNQVSLSGTGTDADGSVVSESWSKLSGPSGSAISDPSSTSTTVTGLTQGTYQFVLKVTDNGGASGLDTVKVIVNTGSKTATPIVNAGDDQSIALPTNTASLNGSASVEGGTISSYNWTEISGPSSANITDANSVSSLATGLVEGTYVFQLRVTDNNNTSNTANVKITVNNPQEAFLPALNLMNPVNGIDYQYFEASNYNSVPNFSQAIPVKTGNVDNFDISVANRPQQFAINFAGYINVPSDGEYTFYTSSDDGSTLYIDGVKVVDNDGPHGQQTNSGMIGLKAGMHAISVGFFNQTGDKGLQVSYEGPGVSKQVIPSSSLYTVPGDNLLPAVNVLNPVNGINYQYFEASNYNSVPNFSQATPVKTGNVDNFDISLANRPQQFAINFTGYINVPSDGEYTFYTSSDDGSILYIDGVKVVDNDGPHGQQTELGMIGLKAGMHAISVGFFNQTGDKGLQVSYAGPGVSKQVIPSSSLYKVSGDNLLPAVSLSNPVNGINYQYFEASNYNSVPDFSQTTPIKTGNVDNFDISVANRAQQFAVNFGGYINVPSDGEYTFYTSSDDGSTLYIDGVQVVDNDGVHGQQTNSGMIGLKAGMHAISVGFFNQTGDKGLQVSYAGPGVSKQVIPSSSLYRVSTQYRKANLDATTESINTNTAKDSSFNKESVAIGHDKVELEVSVKAYPNPFTNSIMVSISGEAGKYNLLLIDALGRTIWKSSGSKNTGVYQQSINTSTLQRGIYFLQVIQNNNKSAIKLEK